MQKKINIVLVIFIILSFFLTVVYNKTHFFDSPVSLLQNVFSSPMGYVNKLKTRFTNFSLYTNQRVDDLKAENEKLLRTLADYEKIKKDNIAFRDQFNSTQIEPQKLIAANVIGFIGDYQFPESFLINKGENDKVKIGEAVIYKQNIVGIVTKTSKTFSQVLLPASANFSIVGESATGAVGILKGNNDFIFFDKVAITDELKEGDFIFTKGEIGDNGIGIPPNIVVGKILSINKTENKPFQNAKVEHILDYSRLEMVFVVKGME